MSSGLTPNFGLHVRGPLAYENAASGAFADATDFDLNMAIIDANLGGGGGGTVAPITVTGDYTAVTPNIVVKMNSASAHTVTLDASKLTPGQAYTVKNINTGVCTVTPNAGTIDGQSFVSLYQFDAVTFFWDGTTFSII